MCANVDAPRANDHVRNMRDSLVGIASSGLLNKSSVSLEDGAFELLLVF
ncbi:hypothetical protein [Paraburkholderia madseniana]|nr:hypothetical protein [Paraburkholderia madseniana]